MSTEDPTPINTFGPELFVKRHITNREELRDLYKVQELSSRAIGTRLRVSNPTVLRWLGESEIPLRSRSEANKLAHPSKNPGEDRMKDLVLRKKRSDPQIAKDLKVSPGTVRKYRKQFDIPSLFQLSLPTEKEIQKAVNIYVKKGIGLLKVEDQTGVKRDTLRRNLRKQGLLRGQWEVRQEKAKKTK